MARIDYTGCVCRLELTASDEISITLQHESEYSEVALTTFVDIEELKNTIRMLEETEGEE